MRTSSRGLRPAVSMSTRSKVAHPLDGFAHLARRADDFHRQVDDVGVRAKLLDGGDAVGVDGDQADAAVLAEAEVGGELGDGGRLADAGGADERDDAAGAGRGGDGAGDAELVLRAVGEAGSRGERVGEVERAARARRRSMRSRASCFVDVGFDQVGEDVEERGRHFAPGRRACGRGVVRRGFGTRRVRGRGQRGRRIADCGLEADA